MELSPSAHVDTFCRDNLPAFEEWPELLLDLPELHYPQRLNCAHTLLDETVARLGAERPCLRGGSEVWTYGDLLHRANQVARVLTEDLRVVPGNRVLLRGPNNPWLVACWFGTLKAGCVAVTTMPMLRAKELASVHDLSSPVVALCDHRFVDELASIDAPGLQRLTYGADGDDDLIIRCRGKSGSFDSVDTAADDVALLAFTSGSTGKPKATMHFHRDVLAIADTFSRQIVKPLPDDVFAGTPPLAFTFGLGGLVVFPMRIGASALLLEKSAPTELADAVAEHNVTVLFTAPTAYRAILAADQAHRLAPLRRCVSAGEALPAAVSRDFFDRTGIRIIDGIGATEMLHVFISASDGDCRPGSTGKAVPGYIAAVLDEDGNPVPDGVPGRLAVKGPTGCRYLADERQKDFVRNGWNFTGDTFIRDADGFFWYQARSDDMIVSSGYNIAGPEVEQALLTHPDVIDCAVVGEPDEGRGMIVKAYVVLRDAAVAGPAMTKELQDFAKQSIAPYKYPRAVEYLSALPRTDSGKLQRFKLRSAEPVQG